MGNSSSTELEKFQDNYIKHGKVKDPNYGEVTHYHEKYNPANLVLAKEQWTNSHDESQDMQGFIENRRSIYHPNLAKNVGYYPEEDKQWCSTFHKHYTAHEYQDNNLAKDIHQRTAYGNPQEQLYDEPDMWHKINSTVQMDTTLAREGGMYHGDIQPRTMMLDKKSNETFIDSPMIHNKKSSYSRMLYDRDNVHVALSPNLCS